MTKEERSAREKLVHHTVKNLFADPELARKARGWSDERLFNELGVTLPTKIPQIEELTPRQIAERQRSLSNIVYAKAQGATADTAFSNRRAVRRKIDTAIEASKNRKKLDDKINLKEVSRRRNIWKQWAIDDALPLEFRRIATRINRQSTYDDPPKRRDKNDKYGHAVAFYMFIYGIDEETAKQRVKPSAFDPLALFYPQLARI